MQDPNPGQPLPQRLPQISVDPSAMRAVIFLMLRVVAIVATAIGTLVAFVKTRDLAGFVNWVKSEDFVQVLTAIGLLASLGSSLWVTLAKKWREVYLAAHVDDDIAIVKPTPIIPVPPAG